MNSLISVVVPVYNVEAYLRKCVKSILEQSFANLEIFLIDDGSTDESSKICEEYAKVDSRIKVIHQENGGLSDARNTGIELANGDYITFIDSDDFVEPDMIEYLHNLISMHDADISVCQRNEIKEWNGEIKEYLHVENKVITGNNKCMQAFFLDSGIDTVAWGKLYKRNLFDGIRYPKGKFHEDVFTTYRLIAKSNCIVVGKEHKYNYILRQGSISNSSFQLKHLDAIEANKIRSEFIHKYYPECAVLANAGIIYATNNCVLRMIKSGKILPDIVDKMQVDYRRYEFDFLRGKSSLKAKVFSIFSYINLSVLIKIGLLFMRTFH